MTALPQPATSHSSRALRGTITVAGDKSISHRSLMLSSQALGTTYVQGLLEGEDVLHTADAMRALGVPVRRLGPGRWEVHGVGVGGLSEPNTLLDMGNSGTSTRLLMGLLATYPFRCYFSGDASLNKRPMKRVITPLSQMGAQFFARNETYLPLGMQGAQRPIPIEYRLPVASAQVKSAIMLAALNTAGQTTVVEPEPTRDHTERMLQSLGFQIDCETLEDGALAWTLAGHQSPKRTDRAITVPADPSSAAFPIVAALITPDSDILVENVCVNHLRVGLYDTLKEMGAEIHFENPREWQGEPVANIRARFSRLKGVSVPAERAPRMIDEYPILAIAAACAEGNTLLNGLAELRVKESNRLQAIIDGLTASGVKVSEDGDNLTIHGLGSAKPRGGAFIPTHLDHRIAMSFLILGLVSEQPMQVDDVACIRTSFPNFMDLMMGLGARIDAPTTQGAPRRRASDKIRQFPAMVVAIDGPAASGKETLGKRLAEYCGYDYLDTGKLYRAVGLRVLLAGGDPNDTDAAVKAAQEIEKDDFFDIRLREERVGVAASIVSAKPEVRAVLLDFQRQFAQSDTGAVLDGRDIGTVVCPEACVKIFLTADVEARANRRYHQLLSLGMDSSYEQVLADLNARDKRDAERAAAPLKAADDAVSLDSTKLDADAVFQAVVSVLHQKMRHS